VSYEIGQVDVQKFSRIQARHGTLPNEVRTTDTLERGGR
jgi:hypothetical protein